MVLSKVKTETRGSSFLERGTFAEGCAEIAGGGAAAGTGVGATAGWMDDTV